MPHAPHRIASRPARCSFAAYLWLAPGYIDIDIPVACHKGGGDFWSESHRTKLSFADIGGVLYVHRQVGSTSDAHDWKTATDAFAYFDEHRAGDRERVALDAHHKATIEKKTAPEGAVF